MLECVRFVGGLVVTVVVVGLAFAVINRHFDPSESKIPELFALEDESFDVLYFGNSIVFQGVNPEVIDERLGTHGYNAALDGSGFYEQRVVLEHLIERNGKPALVVLGVAVNRSDTGEELRPSVQLRLDREQLRSYREFLAAAGEERSELYFAASHVALYRNRSAPERAFKYLVDGRSRVPHYVQGHAVTPWFSKAYEGFQPHRAQINRSGLRSFLSFAEEQDIPVLLVELPNHVAYNHATVGREEVLESIDAELRPGQRFVSMNPDVALYPDGQWGRLNHLNGRGAEEFSKRLAPVVREMLDAGEAH